MEISIIVEWLVHNLPVIFALAAAGTANAIMDKLQFHYEASIFYKKENKQWWDPRISYENKWKKDENGKPITGKEKYFLSSSLLVFLQDGWHMFQMIMFTTFFVAIFVYSPYVTNWYIYIIDYIMFRIAFVAAFTINFSWILNAK